MKKIKKSVHHSTPKHLLTYFILYYDSIIFPSVFRPLCRHSCVAHESLTVSCLCGLSLTLECLLKSLFWVNWFEGFHVWTMQYLRSDKTLCSALHNGLGVANFTAHVSGPYTFQSHAVIWTIWLEAVQAQMCQELCLCGFCSLYWRVCILVFFLRASGLR